MQRSGFRAREHGVPLGDEMSDKPTTQDLLLLEVRDLVASVGELRLQLNGMWQRHTALEGRVKNLESGPAWADPACHRCGQTYKTSPGGICDCEPSTDPTTCLRCGKAFSKMSAGPICDCPPIVEYKDGRTMTGSIQGLEGEFTITPPPEWER